MNDPDTINDLTFQMLIHCSYEKDENDVVQKKVEHLVDDSWEELNLSTASPGFDIFMYAILTCQHMYFKNNAAEYGLVLNESEGLITVITDEHRNHCYH
jgi:glycyl-tRNA synthetase alpha subunit